MRPNAGNGVFFLRSLQPPETSTDTIAQRDHPDAELGGNQRDIVAGNMEEERSLSSVEGLEV